MLRGGISGSLRRQGGGAEIPAGTASFKLIANGKSVFLAQLQVEPRRDFDARSRAVDSAGRVDHVSTRVRRNEVWARPRSLNWNADGVDAGVGIVAAFNAEEVRSLLVECAADGAVVLDGVVGRRRSKRVAGIERAVVALQEAPPMQRIGARFGENLDASITNVVELRREWILVDANLADRRLRRQRSAGKPVDVNLSAIGACRRTRQCLKLIRELVWIVGQRIRVRTFEHNGAGVGVGIGAYGRSAFVGHDHLLLRGLDRHLDLQAL